jgi:uncharacterized cofD-like protein
MTQHLRVACLGGGLGADRDGRDARSHRRHHRDHRGNRFGPVDREGPDRARPAGAGRRPQRDRGARRRRSVLKQLFNHRFETDKSAELSGMAFGNLFIAALAQQEGSFLRGVEEAARLLGIRGKVLPVTLYNTQLCATLADGTMVEEEVNVRSLGKARIERIFLRDADVRAAAGTCEAIEAADLITLGPGSLHTTVCACLLVPEIARAISEARGLVVYVGNTTTQPGQTDDVTLSEHVAAVLDYLGGTGLDAALLNDDASPAYLRDHHAEQGMRYLEPTAAAVARIDASGVRVAKAPIIDKWSGSRERWNKQDTIRHDPTRLTDALLALLEAQRPRLRAVR